MLFITSNANQQQSFTKMNTRQTPLLLQNRLDFRKASLCIHVECTFLMRPHSISKRCSLSLFYKAVDYFFMATVGSG